MRLPSQANRGSEAVKKWGFVAMHTALAATFMFLLQRFMMNATLESSLLWALTFAVCAAGLAYKQANR
ncbi:hypothetical protein JQ612_11670 [Bradyrhizobium manausense]|uniref:hypothetical protein n=1 Tax=Bradyrhizobium manausense TaxID=989370 RepID=UPI001BAC4A75|nr:hypothetical protein [Bradyrhizobium manausense]MBR0688518.1 hypothetical protein [Bradyrhizobium manausense]MBR0720821.1 hypothetical protein [Bradyrhizobium manausense]MBR0833854.1 hypothetical protein [Bradyrhizobium manausense]